MNQREYSEFWDQVDGISTKVEEPFTEPTQTLIRHVRALQERIDQLMHPADHDRRHGVSCGCYLTRCACAYDHPDAICASHLHRCSQCGGRFGFHSAEIVREAVRP